MYLLDTNVCVGLLKAQPAITGKLTAVPPNALYLCAVVKAELYYGARASQHIARNLATLQTFFGPYVSLGFDDGCAERYGELRADLRRTGQLIGAAGVGGASEHGERILQSVRGRRDGGVSLRADTWRYVLDGRMDRRPVAAGVT